MRLPSNDVVKFVRDTVLFLLGVGGVVNEFFIQAQPNPVILTATLPFLFGPAVLHFTEGGKQSQRPPDSSEPSSPAPRS